ncbi:Serine/threonine-protein kinase PrkC [Thalassoglobus neptunius]|uniref:non-specific serine/threonine protein kinase n=1 Tax=Thalassoglobus neptunius TaxID=1938619 RepID=A0A5C5WAD5_9PLAN|nr:serine/threonine-protein kinase [Thalassoglobus neptunius]TWT47019.1 Serine/threonine-protein kinase PrkC [Thalassoglobus neptunius]
MTDRGAELSDSDSNFDPELLEFLERHCDAIQDGEHFSIPEELLKKHPNLMQLVDCIHLLDSMAGGGGQDKVAETLLSSDSSLSSSSFQSLPREFGAYLLEAELGRGGMGVVYRARHQTLDSHFALKMVRSCEFASDEEVRRFFREARAASRLRHSNIVSVHDAGEHEGIPFLVMAYISEFTLADRIKMGEISLDESAAMLVQITRAVGYLHRQDVIHRDLKPSNILIDNDGNALVTDFGLAKVFEHDDEQTMSGAILGTPAYMSPEQAWGKVNSVTYRSDLYSLGAILYELLTGQPPFSESVPLDQILRLRDSEPKHPQKINPAISRPLAQICMRCLEKKPENRYGSADELADDLERFLNHEPIVLKSMGLWNSVRRWARREPALVVHLTAFLVIFTVVQLAELSVPGLRPSYIPEMIILGTWGAASIVFQRLLRKDVRFVRRCWVASDAILFTAAVYYAARPIESLVAGYALLIVASAMWYKPRLVAVTTVTSVISYFFLHSMRGDPETPGHYPYLVAGILIVTGGIVISLVRRILQLLSFRSRF